MNSKNINLKWAEYISNAISDMGIQYICVCPGSRNTPLTFTFTNNSNFICTSHVDERSGSFFALGISKNNNIPSVIISTSGTAVANLFPSIIEASLSKTPLIIITADRPSYLINTGENQTINQKNIFGDYVRKFEDLGLPDEKNTLNKKIKSLIEVAMGKLDSPPGPIHINVPFENSLIDDGSINKISSDSVIEKKDPVKYSNKNIKTPRLDNSIIVCGEMNEDINFQKIINLSEHLKAPILADPTSNIRYYKYHQNIISSYNLFLEGIDFEPKTIIRFGRKPTSKILCQIINNHDRVLYVDNYEKFNDNSTHPIKSDVNYFTDYIINNSPIVEKNINLDKMKIMQNKINPFIKNISFDNYNCEGAIINNILDSINTPANIFIGNSMAIREMDDFSINLDKKIKIYCNRGASGIDGLVSTGLGIAYSDKQKINISIIGDLSFYHDMNGLLNSNKMNINMKFIILNNNGGGIFSQLDIAKLNYDKFKEFWTTPLDLDIKQIADLYKLKYTKIKNTDDLKKISSITNKTEIFDYQISIIESMKNKEKILNEVKNLIKN
tara:strand:- start:368 stop:2035 length:1668 start_codon:yes stop_codon:yes gene_type:complete